MPATSVMTLIMDINSCASNASNNINNSDLLAPRRNSASEWVFHAYPPSQPPRRNQTWTFVPDDEQGHHDSSPASPSPRLTSIPKNPAVHPRGSFFFYKYPHSTVASPGQKRAREEPTSSPDASNASNASSSTQPPKKRLRRKSQEVASSSQPQEQQQLAATPTLSAQTTPEQQPPALSSSSSSSEDWSPFLNDGERQLLPELSLAELDLSTGRYDSSMSFLQIDVHGSLLDFASSNAVASPSLSSSSFDDMWDSELSSPLLASTTLAAAESASAPHTSLTMPVSLLLSHKQQQQQQQQQQSPQLKCHSAAISSAPTPYYPVCSSSSSHALAQPNSPTIGFPSSSLSFADYGDSLPPCVYETFYDDQGMFSSPHQHGISSSVMSDVYHE